MLSIDGREEALRKVRERNGRIESEDPNQWSSTARFIPKSSNKGGAVKKLQRASLSYRKLGVYSRCGVPCGEIEISKRVSRIGLALPFGQVSYSRFFLQVIVIAPEELIGLKWKIQGNICIFNTLLSCIASRSMCS